VIKNVNIFLLVYDYFKKLLNDSFMYLFLYINDMLITFKNMYKINNLKNLGYDQEDFMYIDTYKSKHCQVMLVTENVS